MIMKSRMTLGFYPILTILAMSLVLPGLQAQDAAPTTVSVSMTVTVNVAENKRMPEITQQDVFVKQGKERLKVTGWTPAQGDQAGLDLFILIDDASDSS